MRITEVKLAHAVKFGGDLPMSSYVESDEPPRRVSFVVEPPFVWITVNGEEQGVPLANVLSLKREGSPARYVQPEPAPVTLPEPRRRGPVKTKPDVTA